jgi:succinoglycan biosynthesis protein ExoA
VREDPTVSVLMPVRNEAAFIARSLRAVLAQDYPADRMEILIADGISTDSTRSVIQNLAQQQPDNSVRIVDNPGRLVATGMNAALAQAGGEIIIRVDGHTVIASDYVRQCVAALTRSDASNVGGPMKAVGDGFFGRAVAAATSSRFGVGGARFHYSDTEEWVDTVYMGAWRRDVFSRIGLFDAEMVRNQDDELNYRLRAAGGKILLSPQIKSHYFNRATMGSLWSQYFQYGYWKVRVMQKHPRQMQPRQFMPPLFVATLLVTLLLLLVFPGAGYLFGLVVGAYAIAVATASILAARKIGWQLLPLFPIVFATLHLAYGSGFLMGLTRFWSRWGQSGHKSQSRLAVPDGDKYERIQPS